jgi:hypothetical protein
MNVRDVSAALLAVVVIAMGTTSVLSQSTGAGTAPRTTVAKAPEKPYSAPRTPWGDPDLQGTYTNKDENGIPMERPGQFDGKQIEEVDDSELADLIRERQERAARSAAGIGGVDTGAGPVHWYEHYGAKNSRAWLVVDPADGRIPPQTAEAQRRAEARTAARKGRDQPTPGKIKPRPVHLARPPGR